VKSFSVDVTLTEDSVAIKDPKRGINIFAQGSLPDGSMKGICRRIPTIFLGIGNFENFALEEGA